MRRLYVNQSTTTGSNRVADHDTPLKGGMRRQTVKSTHYISQKFVQFRAGRVDVRRTQIVPMNSRAMDMAAKLTARWYWYSRATDDKCVR